MTLTSQAFTSPAFRFVMLIGIVNLFADITYEGGGAINGQYLSLLGASGATVSIIAGIGEFFGYSLRSVAGYLSDRTKKIWVIIFIGYLINLLSVPAMALAGTWHVAGLLIIAERVGRAFRKPAVEAMLSYATGKLGSGWVYGLNSALDEAGATLGPLMMALMLVWTKSYHAAYLFLLIPTVFAILSLMFARTAMPSPATLESESLAQDKTQSFTVRYWLYMLAGALFAAGLISYELISYHLIITNTLRDYWIPVMLAIVTACGVIANLVLGKSYDRFGLPVLMFAVLLSAAFTPLVFSGDFSLMIASIPLLGIGYAVQDTLLKAIVAENLPKHKRGLAFGVFYTGYGFGWLIGSITSGLLYDYSLHYLAIFASSVQLMSLPIFLLAAQQGRTNKIRER